MSDNEIKDEEITERLRKISQIDIDLQDAKKRLEANPRFSDVSVSSEIQRD